jgi:hypothetical protein
MGLEQVHSLLDIMQCSGTGHIHLFNTLLVCNTKFSGEQRISSWPFTGKMLKGSNRHDLVFIRPPGIPPGSFVLRMDNLWFGRVLLLFSIEAQTDSGIRKFNCAYVNVLEECEGRNLPGNLTSLE